MIIARCGKVKKYFSIRRGYLRKDAGFVKAVDGVTMEIARGETFGIVGESGCGKTTLGKIFLGILKPDSGEVRMAAKRVQAIFQDPRSSLDPRMKVFDILAEGLLLKGESHGAIKRKTADVLDLVKLPKGSLSKYPHQFSGGERQRIAIGRAVLTEPELMVCDEPVSSLDVGIQLQILNLLKDIQKRLSVTYLFISHDMRVVKFMCDRVAVMRAGRIVEEGSAGKIYSNPAHPYTKLLLDSILEISS